MRVLLNKDIRELFRTYRFLVLPVVLSLFGIAAPAVIRLLPVLMRSAQAEIDLDIPELGPADAVLQFLQMARQLGLLAAVLLFMGIVATERRDGTLAVLFVKPVSRLSYVWSRWSVNGLYVLLSFLLGTGLAVLCTRILLGVPDYSAVAAATGLYLCYFLLVFSWTLFFSARVKAPLWAGGLSIIPLFVLPHLGALWKPLGTYGPYGAVAAGTAAIGGLGEPGSPVSTAGSISAVADVVLAVLLVLASYLVLRRAEL